MSHQKKISQRRERRKKRVRSAFLTSELPRISVFRTAKHIYGQVIDDKLQKTLVSGSTLSFKDIVKNTKGDKKDLAHAIGVELAKKMREKGIEKAAFDRGSFLYHGRVEAFAEGLREGGIEI
ncbi:MAG: 50S ribosomal protein L18 [Candidatus Babeliales bacterium]